MLRKACKADIPKFCQSILSKAKEESELEGQVISCLKLKYADQVMMSHLLARTEAGQPTRLELLPASVEIEKEREGCLNPKGDPITSVSTKQTLRLSHKHARKREIKEETCFNALTKLAGSDLLIPGIKMP